ncbi:MAG: C26 family cysteine hydrolase domain-containing family [Thaumarchaeota archaeon]|nr:C26 family cysteine hydrolase domain-containing family [Nitrososphaerota archaeon]
MLLVVDNGSTTLHELEAALQKLKVNYRVIKYSHPFQLDEYSCVILTGRSAASDEINRANIKLVKQATQQRKPLLGICYGAEILALANGGALSRLPAKVYGHNTVYVKKINPLTETQQTLKVFESHIFNISRLPTGFESLAYSKSSENEIIAHHELKQYGLQFHPECSGDDGLLILTNFMKFLKRCNL